MTSKPSIVAFSGHMTDAPDRPVPRFPESRVPDVQARLRDVLERQRRPLIGVSSGARGGDITFMTVMLELGGSVTVLLPFPAADFKKTSIGDGWDSVFDQLILSDRVDLRPPLYSRCPAARGAQEAAFAECNAQIVAEATRDLANHDTVRLVASLAR